MDRWHLYFLSVISGKRQDVFAHILRFLLIPMSWIYGSVVSMRNFAYDHGLLRSHRPDVPLIISIGNITAGGTGKTPTVLLFAQALSDSAPIAILSRGYKATAETNKHPLILRRGPHHSAAKSGDEPYMLAQNLPDAIIIVGKNRTASAQIAYEMGAKVILLDDGMQHRRLARDLEVVMVDVRNPFGYGYLLPRGLMREHAQGLQRADLIVLNNAENPYQYLQIKQHLKQYSQAPTIGTRLEVKQIYNMQRQPIPSLYGKRVGLFCGIAHPERFQQTVLEHGAQIVHQHFLPDHIAFDRPALLQFIEECHAKGAELLVCTEKDFVKLEIPSKISIPIVWLQMQMCVVNDVSHWHTFVENAHKVGSA